MHGPVLPGLLSCRRLAAGVVLIGLAGGLAAAEPAPAVPPPVSARAPAVVSPEIHGDGRATLRVFAPQAAKVELGGIMAGQVKDVPKNFQKDAAGVWTLTVGPLPPDIYYYVFMVDGVSTPDFNNGRVKAGVRTNQSVFEISGAAPAYYDLRADVPHGTVSTLYYDSKAHGGMRQLTVYLPPEYGRDPARRFPVLYLLHGAGDHDRSWVAEGRANLILDNLLAAGGTEPMVVVMPFLPTAGRGGPARAAEPADNPFERDLLGTIMPLVEGRFTVKTGRADTALAGLSMGGGQTMRVGLGHPEKFAWIGAFSAAVFGRDRTGGPQLDQFMKSPTTANADYRLIWIGCGRQDGLFAANETVSRQMAAKGIKHAWHPTEGGHVWTLWREYLRDLLPLLFKNQTSQDVAAATPPPPAI